MDAHAQPEPDPVTPAVPPAAPTPAPADSSAAGDPAAGEPPPPDTIGGWFRQNGSKLAVVVALGVLICRYLHPLDLLLAGAGLSLIIFLHELGHFLAAKWCDVHVKTFSIGFGPALPFCSYKYGETTYKLAMVPLGGFVAMVGEGEGEGDGDGAADEEAEEDPRSFKHKSVGQRMLIISAGVIMNLILGCFCFVLTYMNGVQEQPSIASHVESGSAAWRAGIQSGTEITRMNGRDHPWYDDIRPMIMSTSRGETVSVDLDYAGAKRSADIEPLRAEGALFPQLGIAPPQKLTLRTVRRDDTPPVAVASPAARATAGDGPGFRPGDRIVKMTDPANPAAVTPLDPKPDGLPGEFFDYSKRLAKLAGKPVTFHVVRKDDPSETPVAVTVAPAFRWDVGLRMRMGEVAAVRVGSPAAQVGVQAAQPGEVPVPGDRVVAVEVTEADGKTTRFAAETGPGVKPLDPLRLPHELDQWADRTPAASRKATVTVLRVVDHTEKRIPLTMTWDAAFRYDLSAATTPGAPLPVNGLGFAYHVDAVVNEVVPGSAAAAAGLQPNDKVTQVRFSAVDHAGKPIPQAWDDVRPHQWAFVDYKLQVMAPHAFDAKVERGGQTIEVTLAAAEDKTWPVADLGLSLMNETRLQKADGIADALEMGAYRTYRSIKMIYLQLYSMVFGRISYKLMSGPITLARVSYIIAGEDMWHLLLWIGLISVNLAVVNFLPIPVLDGGHMVFLIYEWVRGKPAPVRVQEIFTYLGLFAILSLMVFVIGLDVWRLFFG